MVYYYSIRLKSVHDYTLYYFDLAHRRALSKPKDREACPLHKVFRLLKTRQKDLVECMGLEPITYRLKAGYSSH